MSYLVTKETANLAIDWVLPTIENLMETKQVKRSHLHIVVIDPIGIYTPIALNTAGILCERSIGDVAAWAYDYKGIARGKADITWRTGLPSHLVQALYPQLYKSGDTVHGGSAIHFGIVVGCSGVQSFFDQMFAYMIAAAVHGIAMRDSAEIKQDNPEMNFFGEEITVK